MCGRFVISKTSVQLASELGVENGFQGTLPSFNIAPTQLVPMLQIESVPALVEASWGLVPRWYDTPPKNPLINARIETILEKPSFREAVRNTRAVIPASGYFEWKQSATGKQPVFIHSDELLLFAAIYEPANPLSNNRPSFSIITKQSAPEIEQIHDRNPVMLEDVSQWLDADAKPELLMSNIAEQSDRIASQLSFYEVNKSVGSVSNNHPGLIKPESEQKLFD